MIKVEGCRACGRTLYLGEIAPGTTVRTETVPLEADAAVQALLGGASLWRVMWLGGRPSRLSTAGPAVLAKLRTEPGSRPVVVEEHRCPVSAQEALSQPLKGVKVSEAVRCPKVPEKGDQTVARGGSAESATPHLSRVCKCLPLVQLEDLVRWAEYVDNHRC